MLCDPVDCSPPGSSVHRDSSSKNTGVLAYLRSTGWLPVAQTVKNLPAVQETQLWSLGWEDPLEKGMATHSTILEWRIPGTEEHGGLQSMWLQRVRHN